MTDILPPTIDVEFFDQYLAGECTPYEAATVRAWLAADPRREQLVADLRAGRAGITSQETDAALEQLRVRLRALGTPRGEKVHSIVSRARSPRWESVRGSAPSGVPRTTIWYAAAAALTLGVSLVATWHAGVGGIGRRLSATTALSTYATERGERANITLPDGSMVTLNVASRLDVPTDYAAGNRTVRLTGEALFTVTHHQGAPFTVMIDETPVRVLGTSFLVRHYPTDSAATVAVSEGRVTVRSVVLSASQGAVLKRGAMPRMIRVGPESFSFAAGVLTLPNMSLPDAVPELDRWYDADIRLGDPSLAQLGVAGKFSAGSLAELTELLKLTFKVRVVRDGRVLTLYLR